MLAHGIGLAHGMTTLVIGKSTAAPSMIELLMRDVFEVEMRRRLAEKPEILDAIAVVSCRITAVASCRIAAVASSLTSNSITTVANTVIDSRIAASKPTATVISCNTRLEQKYI